jgi:glycerophosphoryl diester phosphodiesterase
MLRIYVLLAFFIVLSCKNNTQQTPKDIVAKTMQPSALIKAFHYQQGTTPLISVHRGGSGLKGYPENCLETLQYVNDSISAIFEIDVAKTKDNVLVLMHDNTLERTTTGTDQIEKYTYQELLAFNMVDDFGNETEFKIPKFSEVLAWAKKNKAVLTVDIKRSVDVADVIDAIRKAQAEDISVIITYNVEQALKAYNLAPELLLSVSARNQQELDWLLETDIPTANMMAFTGTRLSGAELYKKNTCLGNYDNVRDPGQLR